jgi:hypothetical protein
MQRITKELDLEWNGKIPPILPTSKNALLLPGGRQPRIAMGQIGPDKYVLRNKSDKDLIEEWNLICSKNYFAKNPSQGYCLAVAAPKVAKFRKTFARLAKP